MKIHAYQVPPEQQESPLIIFDEFPDNVEIYGNRNYREHTSDTFRNLPGMLDDIADELYDLENGLKNYTDFSTILEAYTGRDNYTRQERKKWIDVIKRWTETDEETSVFCDVLQLLHGREYASATICGSCQRDWQYIIYPAENGAEWLRAFECEYFNTGTEWTIKEEDGDEYTVYCTTYDPRAEIANITGADPDDVILYEFDGWERTPKYKEVSRP